MNPSCLIVGAHGLIGSALVERLAGKFDLYGLVREKRTQEKISIGHLHVGLLDDLKGLPPKIDHVVYLAQSEDFRNFPNKAREVFDTNTVGLLNLLSYAYRSQARSFIFASSGAVYESSNEALQETQVSVSSEARNFYSATKLAAEIISRPFQEFFSVVNLRFFFVYGPGQRAGMLIPRLIQNVREGNPISLDGERGMAFTPTFVSDAAAAIESALTHNRSDTFNVAGPEVLDLRTVVEGIEKRLGKKAVIEVKKSSASNFIADRTKMEKFLYRSKLSFSEGIKLTIGNTQ